MSTPQLRFKGFNENWQSKQIGDYAVINPNTGDTPNSFFYIDLESVNKGVFARREKMSKVGSPSRAQRNLQTGDIVFQTVRPYQQNNYFFDLDDDHYVASTGYAQIRATENSKFLYYCLHTKSFLNEVLNKCEGGNYPAINTSNLKEIKIDFPSNQEQEKIASFFTVIDQKLNLLKEKKEKLELYKKGVMQQIFSQKLRFKDEKGNEFPEWVEKRLGKIVSITTGKLDANAMVDNGNYRFYTCAKDYYFIDKFAFDTEALLISGNGANVGYIHHYSGKFNAYQRTYVLSGFKDVIVIYLKYFLQKNLGARILKEKKAGNTPYIVLDTLSEMNVEIPPIVEQQKIADFLSALDTKINLVSTQIEKTELWKKGLLQQMFV